MNFSLSGKRVLVTGAAQGIGFSIAKAFFLEGASVILADINAEKLAQAKDKLLSMQEGEVLVFTLNVTDEAQVKAVFKELEKDGLDVLVNNAGITRDKLMLRMKEEDWNMVLDVNLKGAFFCSKYAAKALWKSGAGRIINITSVIGLMGNAGQANYAASKAGLIGLTKSTAKEFARKQVTVNAIAPGFIETEMTSEAQLGAETIEEYKKLIPLQRMGTPDDIANAALFLASRHAGYITGEVIRVDGGMVM